MLRMHADLATNLNVVIVLQARLGNPVAYTGSYPLYIT